MSDGPKHISEGLREVMSGLLSGVSNDDWARREKEIKESEERFEREHAKAAEINRRRDLFDLGVPAKDVERIASDTLIETTALAAARQFINHPTQRILVLSGTRGCGKTTAAGWLLAQRPPIEHPFPFVRQPTSTGQKFAVHKQSWKRQRFITASWLARCSLYDGDQLEDLSARWLLVIDDLGVEYLDTKGAFMSLFDALFDARYAAGLWTAITTNLPAQEFKARYGERVADRIRETGRFVEIDGLSLRELA